MRIILGIILFASGTILPLAIDFFLLEYKYLTGSNNFNLDNNLLIMLLPLSIVGSIMIAFGGRKEQ